jgi:peptidyl-prolyl cis-trans isomerase D
MFDFVRKHMKIMQFVLFLLIVPSFVLFGVQGYNNMREGGDAVAKVAGQEINQAEWDEAHRREVERLRQQLPNLDAKIFDSAEARYGTLERMVRDRVLAAAAGKQNLLVGDQRVARELQDNQLIASLRGPDGKLDMARYRDLLARQGMTPEMFENQVRADIASQQVLGGVTQSAFTPPAQANVALGSFFERREVRVARFPTQEYRAKVTPTDAELQAFYQENPQLFQQPEQASIEYVVLDVAAMQATTPVNEADLRTYYEQNAGRMTGQEERRASHILVEVPKGASAEAKQQARAKAEALLAEVRKNPDSFAEVAKKNSQDAGSAPQGGDLDWFRPGTLAAKPLEEAAFALKNKGDISGVVESEFGFHIVRLTDVKPAPKQRSFEEVRSELEAQLKREQAQKRYAEAAETFSNTVYEQSDSLKPVADKLKLEVRTAQAVTRTPQPGATGPLASEKFLQSLFSAEALERKRNTEAVEFGPSQMVSGRVVQYQPARTRPFEEVKAQVREQVVNRKAAELARKDGMEKLAAWQAQPASANLPGAEAVGRTEKGTQPPEVVEAALRADPAKLPTLVGVDLGANGYAVVQVTRVLPRPAVPPQQAQQELGQYTRAWATAEAQAYYEMLKDRFKVQINAPQPTPEGAAR